MEAQLREYNAAFTAFFHRLVRDGITQHNTVFLVTVHEGDHYAGGPLLNPGCNGVTVACQYDTRAGWVGLRNRRLRAQRRRGRHQPAGAGQGPLR
jgi:hypothetical protein